MTNRTRKRAKARAQERAQRRQRIILGLVGLAAVIGVVFAIIATRPVQVEVDDELLTRYADLPSSFTDRGFPILGNPEAPARVEEYSSFACPACGTFNENTTPGIVDRVAAGEASFVYVPVLLTNESERAAAAGLCAGEQGRFWEYHDLLFNWQRVFEATAFQTTRLVAGAEALGLDVDEFNTCRSSNRISETIDSAQAAYVQAGARGTPTTLVNNEPVTSSLGAITGAIDAIMANAQPVPVEVIDEADVEVTEEVTEEATEEATEVVTDEVTEEATEAATDEVTEEATEVVTDEVTEEATEAATDEATEEATEAATDEVTEEATEEDS